MRRSRLRQLQWLALFASIPALLQLPHLAAGEPLSGTAPLTIAEPLDEVMIAGINRFALRELQQSPSQRQQFWKRNYSNHESYAQSIAANRKRFQTIIGAVDPRVAPWPHYTFAPVGDPPAADARSGRFPHARAVRYE